MNEYTRAHIRLSTPMECEKFVRLLNGDGSVYKYVLETGDGSFRVSARSYLGVVYFATEHNDSTYLVNVDADGVYPNGIDNFRI